MHVVKLKKKNWDRSNVYFPNEFSRCNWEVECWRKCIHLSLKLSCRPANDYVKGSSNTMHCFHLTDKNILKRTFQSATDASWEDTSPPA